MCPQWPTNVAWPTMLHWVAALIAIKVTTYTRNESTVRNIVSIPFNIPFDCRVNNRRHRIIIDKYHTRLPIHLIHRMQCTKYLCTKWPLKCHKNPQQTNDLSLNISATYQTQLAVYMLGLAMSMVRVSVRVIFSIIWPRPFCHDMFRTRPPMFDSVAVSQCRVVRGRLIFFSQMEAFPCTFSSS